MIRVLYQMKISMIVPAYNSAATIEKCINSVISQEGAELEIIVVNDGSTDNTKDILSSYGNCIKLINKENGGVADARNAGLAAASGDFIMFLDADDCLGEGCIACLAEKQKELNADIVRFEYVISHKNGIKSKPLHYFKTEQFISKAEFKEKIYPLYINSIMLNSVCMTLFKREVIQNLRFRVGMKTAEDAVFSLEAYSKANNVVLLPNEYYIYNQTSGSLTDSGISLALKYKCNIILSMEIIRHLSQWGMKTPYWFFKALFRPLVLTVDKLRRISLSKKHLRRMGEE